MNILTTYIHKIMKTADPETKPEVANKPATPEKKDKPIAKLAVIDRIEPNPAAEKPNIFVGAHNIENPKIRLNNTYYFHTEKCGRISAEQLKKIFKLSTTEIAVQADKLVEQAVRVKYEQTPRKDAEGMNTSFYPEKTAVTAEEAMAFTF